VIGTCVYAEELYTKESFLRTRTKKKRSFVQFFRFRWHFLPFLLAPITIFSYVHHFLQSDLNSLPLFRLPLLRWCGTYPASNLAYTTMQAPLSNAAWPRFSYT